jgi:superfamily II DNA/RNA helicase
VRELAKSLKSNGFSAGEIHGDMDQSSRIAELDRFKAGTINLLVASDVAARGLDVKGVSHVFNFDTPWHPDDYVHRIGRTGRAGATGRAFTFVTPEDAEAIDNVEKLTGGKIPVYVMDGADSETVESEAAPRPRGDKRAPKPRAAKAERVPKPAVVNAPEEAAVPDAVREEPAERPARKERPVREEAPVPAMAEPAPARRAAPREPRVAVVAGGHDSWNGPVPDFLKFSAING